ncbi:MAG TPA: zinc ribbon domain-containing protein [Tepidisphaeraceae bacterium]|jgi:hypothetical protein
MSTTDVQSVAHPPARDEFDEYGVAVQRSLGRFFSDRFSIGALRALIEAALSFGILPLFEMTSRFRNYVSYERQQIVHLSDWLRRHYESDETKMLQDLSRRLRYREGVNGLVVLCAMAVIGVLVLGTMPLSFAGLLDQTFNVRPWGRDSRHVSRLFIIWNAGLGLAYLLHWLQMCIYMAEMRRWVERFNTVAARIGLSTLPDFRPRGSVGWALVGTLFVWFGAVWTVPMAVAGMTQRGYVNGSAVKTRLQLAERMRVLMAQRREHPEHVPARMGPDYRVHLARCAQPLCQAELPINAMFCPRCGAKVGPVVKSA